MINKHDFLPVLDEESYQKAFEYIASQARMLAHKVLGREMMIDTVTVFTHQPEEYEFLERFLKTQGEVSPFSHGATLYVEVDKVALGNKVQLLGARQPDETRPEVGYADFPVPNYEQIKEENLKNEHVSEIESGNGIKLLELMHPEFDVRGYIVNEQGQES